MSYRFLLLLTLIASACNNDPDPPPGSDIAKSPEELNVKIEDILKAELDYAKANNGKVDDSARLRQTTLVGEVYDKFGFTGIWSNEGKWFPAGDSVVEFIANSKLYGLFPSDYHYSTVRSIRDRISSDTGSNLSRMDAVLWAKADLLLTDAVLQMINDVKLGRLPLDSVSGRKDTLITNEQYLRYVDTLRSISITQLITSLEPVHSGYHSLKSALKDLLLASNEKHFTVVPAPNSDPAQYKHLLQKRLFEEGFMTYDSIPADSLELVRAVKKFQKVHGMTVDGIVGSATLRMLNLNDHEKFIRVAITLDRYKLLPEKMPFRYLWVNIPSYKMQLREADSIKLESKIIVGKPQTRTPLLTSAISELITYPQWTMPNSIIVKEVLPAARKDPGYFEKKGYSLIDGNGDVIDPYTVEWTKYRKGIPYKVVQGSGDDNALGVLKFNFYNKYAVYLHDTNQRYLFARDLRSLSHGCVRVQEWEKLAYTLIRYDNATNPKTSPMEDSLGTWLSQKVKRSIPIRNRVQVYIRYFTCEADDRGLVFYDDIYGEDRELREKYFAGK